MWKALLPRLGIMLGMKPETKLSETGALGKCQGEKLKGKQWLCSVSRGTSATETAILAEVAVKKVWERAT